MSSATIDSRLYLSQTIDKSIIDAPGVKIARARDLLVQREKIGAHSDSIASSVRDSFEFLARFAGRFKRSLR